MVDKNAAVSCHEAAAVNLCASLFPCEIFCIRFNIGRNSYHFLGLPQSLMGPMWDEHPLEALPLTPQQWHVALSGGITRRSSI